MAFLDIQACYTFVGPELALKYGEYVSEDVLDMSTDFGVCQQKIERYQFPVKIQDRFFMIEAYSVEYLPHTLIIGLDWLNKHQVQIDFRAKRITFGNQEKLTVLWGEPDSTVALSSISRPQVLYAREETAYLSQGTMVNLRQSLLQSLISSIKEEEEVTEEYIFRKRTPLAKPGIQKLKNTAESSKEPSIPTPSGSIHKTPPQKKARPGNVSGTLLPNNERFRPELLTNTVNGSIILTSPMSLDRRVSTEGDDKRTHLPPRMKSLVPEKQVTLEIARRQPDSDGSPQSSTRGLLIPAMFTTSVERPKIFGGERQRTEELKYDGERKWYHVVLPPFFPCPRVLQPRNPSQFCITSIWVCPPPEPPVHRTGIVRVSHQSSQVLEWELLKPALKRKRQRHTDDLCSISQPQVLYAREETVYLSQGTMVNFRRSLLQSPSLQSLISSGNPFLQH